MLVVITVRRNNIRESVQSVIIAGEGVSLKSRRIKRNSQRHPSNRSAFNESITARVPLYDGGAGGGANGTFKIHKHVETFVATPPAPPSLGRNW